MKIKNKKNHCKYDTTVVNSFHSFSQSPSHTYSYCYGCLQLQCKE